MADWPIYENCARVVKYPTGAGNYDYTLTITASNTKSNYVEVTSSLPYDSIGFVLQITAHSDTGNFLFDVAIGSAGSEIDIVSNLLYQDNTFHSGENYHIPIPIASGNRVALRVQGSESSQTVLVAIAFYERSFKSYEPCNLVTTYGADTSDSGGISIDPGASADTKGSYTEITSSTDFDSSGIMVSHIFAGSSQTSTRYDWNVDIAIGSAGNEVVLIADLPLTAYSTADNICPRKTPFLPICIPAGTRISARASCSGTNATYRIFDIAIYLFS